MDLFFGPRSLRLFIFYYFYFFEFFYIIIFSIFLLFKYFVNSVLFYIPLIPAPSPPLCMQCEVLALAFLFNFSHTMYDLVKKMQEIGSKENRDLNIFTESNLYFIEFIFQGFVFFITSSRNFTSCNVMPRHTTSCTSCHVMPHHVTSCNVT